MYINTRVLKNIMRFFNLEENMQNNFKLETSLEYNILKLSNFLNTMG